MAYQETMVNIYGVMNNVIHNRAESSHLTI